MQMENKTVFYTPIAVKDPSANMDCDCQGASRESSHPFPTVSFASQPMPLKRQPPPLTDSIADNIGLTPMVKLAIGKDAHGEYA